MIRISWKHIVIPLAVFCVLVTGYVVADMKFGSVSYTKDSNTAVTASVVASTTEAINKVVDIPAWPLLLDKTEYDKRILALVDYVPPGPVVFTSTSTDANGKLIMKTSATTPASPLQYSSSTNVTISGKKWPPAAVYPQGGAVLPFKRIVAYYGNFYSRKMGILGELEPEDMLAHLADIQARWEAVDPATPVLPAIEYIAMVAQADAGSDGMYRSVMPDVEIEKAYALAQKINGVMILDIQVGLSPLKNELSKFKKYLERPDVFFALDPEFSMKGGQKPGTIIGTFDATDINYTINYMADIVRENNLPPKVLLVHRFTQDMITGAASIVPQPEVQVVMVMDGWGPRELKRGTYKHIIEPEPVQFTGIKVFYKNDLKAPSTGLLTPAEIMQLYPKPIYIQYQ